MNVDVLLKNDFFYDEGTLTPDEMATLVSRITDRDCGVPNASVSLELLTVHRYEGEYYHLYRTLHQDMTQRFSGLTFVPRKDIACDAVVHTQADLFHALRIRHVDDSEFHAHESF